MGVPPLNINQASPPKTTPAGIGSAPTVMKSALQEDAKEIQKTTEEGSDVFEIILSKTASLLARLFKAATRRLK